MNSYERVFGDGGIGGGGLVSPSVPTLTTGVPLSARFKQIQLTAAVTGAVSHGQNQSQGFGFGPQGAYPDFIAMGGQIPQLRQQRAATMAIGLQGFRQQTRALPLRTRIGQPRPFRVIGGSPAAAGVLRNRMAAAGPFNIKTSAGIARGTGTRGRPGARAPIPLQGNRGLAGRVGTPATATATATGRSPTRGGRGRTISTRGRAPGGLISMPKKVEKSKEDLDSELDLYMSKNKRYLDSQLDDYMAQARAAAAVATTTATSNQPTDMES